MKNNQIAAGLSRRHVLKAGAGFLLVLTAGPKFAAAQAADQPDLVLLNLADLHSPYDRLPRLLTLIRQVKQRHPGVPHVLLFNGDLFETGNVVAARSKGAADWAFLRAVQQEMPVIFNIGNHEADFIDHPEFVRRARALGVSVITNLYDQRTGAPFARTFTTIQVGERLIPVLGLAVAAVGTYRKEVRPTILPPNPVDFFKSAYPALRTGAPLGILLSHAGVVPDKSILPLLTGSNLVVGGHDHLHLRHDVGQSLYLHNGFKGERLNVVTVKFGPTSAALTSEDLPITADVPSDQLLALRIARERAQHLQPADVEVLGHLERSYSVQEAALWAIETIRKATGADIVAMNHTSFGAGLPAGNVSRSAFNEFLRFDNKIVMAQVDSATVAGMLKLANQHQAHSFEELTGDFVYTNPVALEPGRKYTLVSTDYLNSSTNQPLYFGRGGIPFEVVPETTSKGLLEKALKGGG